MKKKENDNPIWSIVVVVLIISFIFIVYNFFTTNLPEPDVQRDITDDDAGLGSPTAKITIVAFSDYQCPACKVGEDAMDQILEEYGDQIYYVFRDFPLDLGCNKVMQGQLHPFACKAAEATECAKEQGKFWEMHKKLFQNQKRLSVQDLISHAKDIGLDLEQFNTCLIQGKYSSEILQDIDDGIELGINSTPTFFINGTMYHNEGYSKFKQIIESHLHN